MGDAEPFFASQAGEWTAQGLTVLVGVVERAAVIRLLIVDDHLFMRDILRQLFSVSEGIDLVGEAASGAEAVERLLEGGVDLVLLDMNMPGPCGDELIARIRTLYPELPILVFTLCNQASAMWCALRAGASGFLVKGGDPDTLVDAVRRVAGGECFLDPSTVEDALF